MPTVNPIDILLQHDQWATTQILLACEKLTAEQFAQRFDLGPGSLQATVTHIIGAMRAWTDALAQRPPAPRIDVTSANYTAAELFPIFDSAVAEFGAQAKRRPLEEVVARVREGKEFLFPRVTIITHVATHSMHHRAQCLNMLKHLGVKPLPLSSVVEWMRAVDFPQ